MGSKVQIGCKSRLLFAKIAMAIWFQVSGVRCQHKGVSIKVSGVRFQVSGEIHHEGTIHQLRHTLPFPQLTSSGVLVLVFSAPMFFLIHSTTDIDV
jgi:hypothetical protein